MMTIGNKSNLDRGRHEYMSGWEKQWKEGRARDVKESLNKFSREVSGKTGGDNGQTSTENWNLKVVIYWFIIYLLSVLGFELRTLYLLSRCSTAWAILSPKLFVMIRNKVCL
jgi:hypothetical protein